MAIYGGKPYTSFKGVNTKDGFFRLGSTASAHMNPSYNAGDKALYSKDNNATTLPYFWNSTTAFSIAQGFVNVRVELDGK